MVARAMEHQQCEGVGSPEADGSPRSESEEGDGEEES